MKLPCWTLSALYASLFILRVLCLKIQATFPFSVGAQGGTHKMAKIKKKSVSHAQRQGIID
ncbi:uncharacterized protein BDV17DRAFT_270302 [Aspergillus undulatus]|uniref:uncharacterized protein n=1 Tax=Aspergillus undulatus TaxID=1810928 RepID=UPI003CCE0D21